MKKSLTLIAAALSAAAYCAVPLEWRNLDAASHFGGRMASAGYLRGKVVMVDCRDYGEKSCVEPARRLQAAWNTFKMKPFVLIGSHRGKADAEKIRRIADRLALSYPIYRGASYPPAEKEDAQNGWVYVVDATGRVLYRGVDDRRACGVVASALMAMRSPQSVKQWRYYLDFDIDVLPGRALNRLEEFRKAYPQESSVYDDAWRRLSSDGEVRKMAKLERLARQAKDYDFNDSSARRLSAEKIERAVEGFSDLKQSSNPMIVQEAKNCIAELMWSAAVLKKD